YLVLAAGAGYRADWPDVRKFLDSFRPLPAPAAPPGGLEKKDPIDPGPKGAPPPKGEAPAADPNRPRDPHGSAEVGLAFREQGKWLCTATEGREVLCWDVAERRVRRKIAPPAENGEMGAFAVSPDGRRVALALHGGLLRLTDVKTGAATVLSPQGGAGIS